MKITIRKKLLKDGKESIYLDYTHPISKKRTREFLKLSVFTNPKSRTEKEHNKKTELLAESVRSKGLLELQLRSNGFSHLIEENKKRNFIDYFKEQKEARYNSKGNYDNWDAVEIHLKKHFGDFVPFSEINVEFLKSFKNYLKNVAVTKSRKNLSQNTCHSYFNKVKACLKQALKDKMIMYNPALDVEGFKPGEVQKAFLTLDELRAAFKAECDFPIVKKAFLFSALTGLRWSDINKLTWKEIQFSKENGWYIRFRQKKTDGVETHPISDQARELLGEQEDFDNPRVFVGLKYGAHQNNKIQQWMYRAEIYKTITFHCARHTYATLQLTLGTDIYTVSKLLGHKDVRTTQVYAKIIDQKKIEAANKIPNIKI